MNNNLSNFFDSKRQKRIKENQTIINTEFGNFVFHDHEITTISESGDVETKKIKNSHIIRGERLNETSIVGQCEVCLTLLSRRTLKICNLCFGVYCIRCSRPDEFNENWFCLDCLKKIKRRQAWLNILRFCLSPFIQRIEQ